MGLQIAPQHANNLLLMKKKIYNEEFKSHYQDTSGITKQNIS